VSRLLDCLYLAFLLLISPWMAWQAMRTGKYRRGFATKFFGLAPRRMSASPCVWLHAVSVGEVNLLGVLIGQMAERHPGWQCVISTTTLTGFTLARSRYPGVETFYCPFDFSWAVRRALARVRPSLLVLAELELWPNLIRLSRSRGVRVAIVNGRLSDHSFRGYHRLRRLVGPILRQVDLIAVQNAEYAERFLGVGASPASVRITGSIKFDGAQTERNNPATQRLKMLAGIQAEDEVFLAGSTQEPEEALALAAFAELTPRFPALRLVLVPRHPERFGHVAQLLTDSGLSWQLRSRLEVDAADPAARVLLVDRVGELGAWWGTATIALVGGSFGKRGGQNMIEPAAYGAAVCFGPRTSNFRDVVAALLADEGASMVEDGAALTGFVRRCLENPQFAAQLGQRARSVVLANQGATRRTLDLLEQLLPAEAAADRRAA